MSKNEEQFKKKKEFSAGDQRNNEAINDIKNIFEEIKKRKKVPKIISLHPNRYPS